MSFYYDCFGGGRQCTALTDRYKDKYGQATCTGCPFYKSHEDLRDEGIRTLSRLSRLGILDDVVEKYGNSIIKVGK